MGVYIKGMEMPPNGLGIGVVIRSDETVDTFCIDKTDETVMFVNRTGWKAISVPTPHGRLVDIDAEVEKHDCVPILGEHLKSMAKHMITVIESEE